MPRLNSSCIRRVEYDGTNLRITFVESGTYTLRRVPEEHYIGLITASSPGRYFNRHLKGRY